MLPRRLWIALTTLITLVWAGSVVVGLIDPARRDPYISGIFGIVVGSLYVVGARRSGTGRSPVDAVRERLATVLSPEEPPADGTEPGGDQSS
ncbi:hypothetical protein ACFXGA_06080 [Actinosynnema sp. NPDC059335]|uniref:hypothetical protein n=1 Tax=Actinosynnema sp. NPDC059335 TaxID=3346804 RepID=UPI00366FEB54